MNSSFSTVSKDHIYFRNAKDNSRKPPWFINCGRVEAEEILKKYQQYGNVLIRPNTSFPKNGSYALSAVTKFNGETKFVHYLITRTSNGFKLEVQSKPQPMPCLSDVLEYYVRAAGSQNHHALVFDPKDPTNTKPTGQQVNGNSKSYVNIDNPDPEDSFYLSMDKTSHLHRRVSAPTVNRDYVNLSKGPGKSRSVDHSNDSEFAEEPVRAYDGHDYMNMNGTSANRTPGRPTLTRNTGKASSFSGHAGDSAPSYRAPSPPSEPIYLQPSNADDLSDDTW